MSRVKVNTKEIQRRRKSLGLTMDAAAAKAGLAGKQQWFAVEGGKTKNPSVQTMAAIAMALGCGVEDLLTKSKPPRPRRKPQR